MGMECVSTTSFTILVNGQPSEPFSSKKGLRQGDPISPHPFALVMEYFNRSFSDLGHAKLVFFGEVVANIKCSILQHLGLYEGVLPIRYLEIPLSSKCPTSADFAILIERILSKIRNWTSRFLSFAGRLQLIKSAIYNMHAYWGSIFLLPKKVIQEVGQLCRDFLWTGSYGQHTKAKVAWSSVEALVYNIFLH
ncbi:uncharacterized protein LOC109827485 [Asparagus officinalis]|uniref:uncharacterized protein LOC109827485 n=1 Tax=Asparagus officinalis TaxID=4686 RepID=UPI00098E12D8|nr:uncharacterized protein LOC109827485 [Asparagus officinalis]